MNSCRLNKTIEMFNHKKNDAAKHSLSNEKRLESVKLKTQHNKVQLNLIKSALAEIDSGKVINKRIVFGLEDEDEIVNDNNGFARGFNNKDKKQLFADSDDDDNEITSDSKGYDNEEDVFSIKPQFEGRKGQELLELQSRFKSDERFQLDKRFIESDSDDSAKEELDTALETMDVTAEKEKNFEILQSVLGMQFPTQPMEKKLSKHRAIKDTSKLHYDPTREDAENFEIKRQSNSETSSKKKKQKMTNSEPVVLPEVSKEKFYKVETNLKDVFNKASEPGKFSFLKEFGHDDNSKKEDKKSNDYFAEQVDRIKPPSFEKNAFRYDSSDDEDINKTKEPSSRKRLQELPEQSQQQNRSTRSWKFFLSEDDPRLKEGVQYFRRRGTDEEIEEWWRTTRNSMLDIIQAKRKIFKRRTNVNRRLGRKRWK